MVDKKLMAILLLIPLAVMVYSTIVVCIDILDLRAQLDNLYWIAENTHSGMVGYAIDRVESMLHEHMMRLAVLTILTISTILVIGLLMLKHRQTGRTRIKTSCLVMAIFLISVLLTPIVNAPIASGDVPRYYARVRMDVPEDSHLIEVSGDITPRPLAGLSSIWVCYHIGIVFLDPVQWIGGGYDMEVGIGAEYYIEWLVDGVYGEMWTSGVVFDEQILVTIYDFRFSDPVNGEPQTGWKTSIHDKDSNLILIKHCPDLPYNDEHKIEAVAGGETVDPSNHMDSHFSGLGWHTYDPDDFPQYEWAFWESEFPCTVVEDSPYSTTISIPYYQFDISGGTGVFFPPGTPSRPSGSDPTYVGLSSGYYTTTIDPEGDDIRYQFDWGDGSDTTMTGWRPSGLVTWAWHTWYSSGTYDIQVRAQDFYGEWGGWSPAREVIVKYPALSISTYPSSGTTDPAPGTHAYIYGARVTVTAIPNPDRAFCFWILDGYLYKLNPITVTMTSDHDLCAYFSGGGGGGGGGGYHLRSFEPV